MNAVEQMPTLPAMKHLADLSTMRPTVIIDSREQCPFVFSRLPSIRGCLQTGDYSFLGGQELFAVERKSIADLITCVMGENRERLERELHRLRGFRFARLLVVGDQGQITRQEYRSNVSPRSILNSLHAWEARYIPVVWTPDPESAARQVESWVYWFARELCESVNNLLRAQRRMPRKASDAVNRPT